MSRCGPRRGCRQASLRPSANTTILERYDASSITGLGYRMAIDRRMQPQNGNVHNTEAEMWFVLDGSGTVTTGGKLVPIMKGQARWPAY